MNRRHAMPPKQSRKAVQKEQKKSIDDQTFGLKNKNRSAKVQAFVRQVESSVKSGNRQQLKAQKDLEAARQAKEDKKAFEAAMANLMRADVKKPSGDTDDGEDEEDEEGEDVDKQLGVDPNDYLWRPEDFEDVEFELGRLEEILEAQRAALVDRTDLTPVTEESFRAWREAKKKEKADMEKRRVDEAKKGKGRLRGWDLWKEKRELFVDDEDGEVVYEKEFEDATLFDAAQLEELDPAAAEGAAAAAPAAAAATESEAADAPTQ